MHYRWLIEFEYDPVQSESNTQKHGIDFEEAEKLWRDDGLVVLASAFAQESRYLAIGQIDNVHWTAIFTERGHRTRIISVRRSRSEEKALYERNK